MRAFQLLVLGLTGFAVGASAHGACPALAGTYRCVDETPGRATKPGATPEEWSLRIDQPLAGGHGAEARYDLFVLKPGGTEQLVGSYVADGKPRPAPEEWTDERGERHVISSYFATCPSDFEARWGHLPNLEGPRLRVEFPIATTPRGGKTHHRHRIVRHLAPTGPGELLIRVDYLFPDTVPDVERRRCFRI
ncbi:MAG: hypothetical protein HY075_01290 [Deltaproteobacteria bacterium]|nr:hypothetical protein [Deltaproteobacteria bacterium]